jgi:hypothetical protein
MMPSDTSLSAQKTYTDIHVHGVPRVGMTSISGWRRHLFGLFARQTGSRGTGPEAVQPYMDTLIRNLRHSRYVRRAVLLALDRVYDAQGTPHQGRKTGFAVTNEEVLAWCRMAADTFLFGASVHPHRRDALAALEWCRQQGAVLVKWLPNYQGIDPAARRHLPYYRKLIELGLPLLCHTGFEFALPAFNQDFGRLERLHLPLEEGVSIIAAHSGSSGNFLNRSAMHRFARALHRFPNLYGETAALALPNRMGALLWWRGHRELFDRLFFATDFPMQLWTPLWRPFLSRRHYAHLTGESNPFDRMVLLLKGLDIHPQPDGFETLLHHMRRSA